MNTSSPNILQVIHVGRFTHIILCCLLGMGISTSSQAFDNRQYAYPDYGIDFALELSRLEMDLNADGKHYPVNQKRISINIFDVSATDVTYGFLAGSSFLSLDNDPDISGLQLEGFHFGLALRADVIKRPRVRLEGHYLYQETQDKTSSDTVTMDWYEWQLASSISFDLSSHWRIILGGAYTSVDAEQRTSGVVNQTLSLNLAAKPQGQLEFEMLFPNEGRVSLAIVRGNQEGIKLNFARRF